MNDILVLLVLLCVQTTKVCSNETNSDEQCRNTTHYFVDDVNLCCKKCPPGHRLKQECTDRNDSICEQCGPNLYMENWNYAINCLKCATCKSKKGLMYDQQCNSTSNAMCVCQPGKFCLMGYNKPYCTDCKTYTPCKLGYGVSVAGTEKSDVRCEKCPSGTFSNNTSTERCKPHKTCNGRPVVTQGNATSDTVCEEQATMKMITTESVVTTASAMQTTIGANLVSTIPRGTSGSTQSVRTSFTVGELNTESQVPTAAPGNELIVPVIAVVIGFLLIFFFLLLLFLYKLIWRRGSLGKLPKIDANGNHESADKIGQNQTVSSEMINTAPSPEQVCLLENVEMSNNPNQCNNNYETLTRTDGCSSHESFRPLQSTSISALSEPMTLLSNTDPASPPPSIPTQSSSQPTSPQIISPVTNSPHVNVNITLHIGNGSCGTSSFIPTDLGQAECKIPFGEEEEFVSTPQQEAGKQMLISVQEESDSFNT